MLHNILNRHNIIRRYILPKTLFGRFIFLIIIPVLMVQIISLSVFFQRHWEHTTRFMAQSLSSEILTLLQYAQQNKDSSHLQKTLSLHMQREQIKKPLTLQPYSDLTGRTFIREWKRKDTPYKASIKFIKPDKIHIILYNNTEKLTFTTYEYRLYTNVTAEVVFWTSIVMSIIFILTAIAFARNQAKPILELSRALISFSRGSSRRMHALKIRGSNEVRTAIHSFKTMATRIERHRQQRTDMLSGISHDIRTPLTRMKLIVAIMDKDKNTQKLSDNIQDMQNMLEGYLAFVRSSKKEKYTLVHLNAEIKKIAKKWHDTNHNITFTCIQKVSSKLQKTAIIRMIDNIISNALQYGENVDILLNKDTHNAIITIIDNGCGIEEKKLQKVFQPFVRTDESRNTKTGGIGLGLTVALDIASAHGGTITLKNRTDGQQGLCAIILLPISMDA